LWKCLESKLSRAKSHSPGFILYGEFRNRGTDFKWANP